jgi:hypothetical protein
MTGPTGIHSQSGFPATVTSCESVTDSIVLRSGDKHLTGHMNRPETAPMALRTKEPYASTATTAINT